METYEYELDNNMSIMITGLTNINYHDKQIELIEIDSSELSDERLESAYDMFGQWSISCTDINDNLTLHNWLDSITGVDGAHSSYIINSMLIYIDGHYMVVTLDFFDFLDLTF